MPAAGVVASLMPCARSSDPVTSQLIPRDTVSGAPQPGCTQLKLPAIICLGAPCGRELWLGHTTTHPWKGCPCTHQVHASLAVGGLLSEA